MNKIIEEILKEVDLDIREFMLDDSSVDAMYRQGKYKNWEMLVDATKTILMWQELRDRKKK